MLCPALLSRGTHQSRRLASHVDGRAPPAGPPPGRAIGINDISHCGFAPYLRALTFYRHSDLPDCGQARQRSPSRSPTPVAVVDNAVLSDKEKKLYGAVLRKWAQKPTALVRTAPACRLPPPATHNHHLCHGRVVDTAEQCRVSNPQVHKKWGNFRHPRDTSEMLMLLREGCWKKDTSIGYRLVWNLTSAVHARVD